MSASIPVEAQFYFFGRNKVQYEKFDWKIIKTAHFDIYYYGEFGEMAEIGAKFAEEAYEEHKIKFNHIVNVRIPLIFYNTHIQFEQTNTIPGFIPEGVGGFFEFIKGRVVIPYLGSLDQFRHVIRHELVHVFMTSKVLNVLSDHRIQSDRYPPLWFVEGLAEYWSYHWDTQAEMVMRDAVINNIFVPLNEIDKIYGSFLMYKEGQNFLEFVSKTYGEEKILLLMENIWRFSIFKENLEYTLGESINRIDEKWSYYLKRNYYPLMGKGKTYKVGTIPLTEEGFNFTPVYVKRDTTEHIYFIGNRTGYSSVFDLEFNSDKSIPKELNKIIEGENESIFESFHMLQPSIDVSNNGLIAFVTKSGPRDNLHLYSIDKDELIQSLSFENIITIRAPKFSHDGNLLVFGGIDNKGFSDIFIYNVAKGKLKRLTNDYYDDRDPIFNKEGDKIIFTSDRTTGVYKGKYNLFEIDTLMYKINYVTYVDANIYSPHFNPSFTKLYFNSDYDGTFNIWEIDSWDEPHYEMKKKTSFITSVFDFSFINDSTVITSGFEKFSFQLYQMKISEDETSASVKFNYDGIGNKWIPDRIVSESNIEMLKYDRKYSLDYAFSQLVADPIYGARGGAVLSVSDLMSDDKYYFLLYNTAEVQSEILENFNVAITRVNSSQRTNYGYGIFHFSGRRYDIRESNDFFYERIYGGVFQLLYPFSSFQRLELGISLANSDRKLFDQIIGRKALLLTNTLSFVHDNSLWGPTGPVDGSRFRLLLGYTSDIKFSNANFYSFIIDYRKYFRTSLRTTIATRAAVFINEGKEARRYIAGGSWDLRGWPRWSIRGEKLWLSSVEFRFPLIDKFYIKFPFFGLGFTSIRGGAFFDAGGAWDEKYKETLGSIGVGLRLNLFNVVAFRYDIGKKIEGDFTRLQPRLFYQFFFGWDF